MTKIVWMSDPHFQHEGLSRGLNTRTRLALAIEHMNTHHSDADLAIMSGDLVGKEVDADYRAFAAHLGKASVPFHALVGNDDDRIAYRKHLPIPDGSLPDFIQYSVLTDAGLIICLDTHQVGELAGEFCVHRREWLGALLDRHAQTPAYIFMHHPPMRLGLPMQDEIKLKDGDSFLDLLRSHGNVKHLFIGHVHRPTCGSIQGIPFATVGALSFQAPAPRPEWDWSTFSPAAEPPHYAVVLVEDGNVTVQYTQFCTHETGMEA